MISKFRNTGQTCVCANRILVQEGVYDAFAEKLAVAVKKLKVGPGLEDGVSQGPLIDTAALDKVEEHVADAKSKGAKVMLGGDRHDRGGTSYHPTVLTDVTTHMKANRQDTFGPVAPRVRLPPPDADAALAHHNDLGCPPDYT